MICTLAFLTNTLIICYLFYSSLGTARILGMTEIPKGTVQLSIITVVDENRLVGRPPPGSTDQAYRGNNGESVETSP